MAGEDEDRSGVKTPDLSKLTDLLDSVSKVDDKGKQTNPITVLILVIVIGVIIAGVGISMGLARRKAAKAQYEADKLKEEAKRVEVDANVVDLRAAADTKIQEAASLAAAAAEHEAAAKKAKDEYEDLAVALFGATGWDDVKVREEDDET